MKEPAKRRQITPDRDGRPLVVGLGASAGGLKALQTFVRAIPPDSGMAWVVVLHLDPDRESRMAELLQDRSSIPVTQVDAPTPTEPNHIYIAPPDRDMEMQGAVIGLRERSDRSERVPIDLFFRTLAEADGADATGVILSGTGHDGTVGIRAIREAGGITVAQSPDEADYDSMPSSAIATGLVDLVMPAGKIPAELIRLRGPAPLLGETEDGDDVEEALDQIFALLRSRTGHDFAKYKRPTVLRRVERRLLFNGVQTLDEYIPLLREKEEECEALMRDLLISVSSFFRDPEEFEALAEVVPDLFDGKGPDETVRAWVVGCATGEEAYSLAMILSDHAATLEDPPRVQIFATDIDEKGYASGREGLYPPGALAHMEPERIKRSFTKEPRGYRIHKDLRELVLFALHNVLHDPPFARLDLISCRNLFIYLRPEAQAQVLESFHYALKTDGLLFLGSSESVGDGTLFEPAASTGRRIFRRRTTSYRVLPRLSTADPLPTVRRSLVPTASTQPTLQSEAFAYGAVHVRLLEQYGHPSIVVDEQWDVVHLSAGAGRFLQMREGEPSRRLRDLAPEDVWATLRSALHQAFENGQATDRRLKMALGGVESPVTVHVRPGAWKEEGPTFALVLFEEEVDASPSSLPPRTTAPASDETMEADLVEEYERAREELAATRVAHDRSVSDLQTANEELRSINEEQRATTEELETGREEIQAVNEELASINQEHQSTIEELRRTNTDLQNLIESTEIGTIFLDPDMRIRRYTDPVTRVFNFVDRDHGRALGDITHRLRHPGIVEDVGHVIRSRERIEREVESEAGEWFVVRINPYLSAEGALDGAIITVFDHTEYHRIQDALEKATELAEEANRAKGTFLLNLAHALRTPLGSILGYAETLHLGGELTPEQDEKVGHLGEVVHYLVSMTEDLLSFAQLDGNRDVVDTEDLDARAILHDVQLIIEPLAERKGLTFTVEPPGETVAVTTDANKARHVLVNLCGNAVARTDSGQVNLTVGLRGDRVVFEVRDTGPGIAAEHQELIFERLWQVESGPIREGDGLGIGLAAAWEYAQLLGGDVEMESEPGEGSIFRFWLPAGERDR
ncbi:MAG: chemotaxis protein CheB [Longimicrobiales bacterium]|nr:chemotaxis protein CheB [Longimicrobiales bacterium]